VGGLENPTTGQIWFDEERVDHLSANKRDIAMVFQSYALYPHMNVYENISFPLRMMRMPKSKVEAQVEHASTLLGISELLRRKPRELSGGQRQRVALARAIVREPAVYLMDEPLSNLDAKLRVTTRAELKKLHQELGTTLIYVTHDQEEALTMSDMIAVMEFGQLQQYGACLDVYNRPANIFVAGFIGSPPMNFIEGQLGSIDGHPCFRWSNLHYPISGQLVGGLEIDGSQELVLGIRPEAVSLSLESNEESLEGKVYVVELLGTDSLVTVEIGGAAIKAKVDAELGLESEQRVAVEFASNRLYLFDGQSGILLSSSR
jgi:multiple sugar transport system ATP-binding protein